LPLFKGLLLRLEKRASEKIIGGHEINLGLDKCKIASLIRDEEKHK
jgi:hypothetical protein